MKNIDDILRERLYDTEVAPPPFVWPNVERELHRRRRRAFFWWSFGGLLLAAGIWQFGIRNSEQWAARTAKSGADVRSEERDVRPTFVPSASKSEEPDGRPALVPSAGKAGKQGLRPNFSDKKSTANISRSAKTGVVEAADKSEDQQVETASVRASGGAAVLPPSDVRASRSAYATLVAGPAADEAAPPTTATAPTSAGAVPTDKTASNELLAAGLQLARCSKAFSIRQSQHPQKAKQVQKLLRLQLSPQRFSLGRVRWAFAGAEGFAPCLARRILVPSAQVGYRK